MSPVAKSSGHAGRALTVAAVGVVVAFGGMFARALLVTGHTPAGSAHTLDLPQKVAVAETKKHQTLLIPNLVSKQDDVLLQHLGTNPDKGWYAFPAAAPHHVRSCTWTWQPREHLFRAACDRRLTAPANGAGLARYRVTVENGVLSIDLTSQAGADQGGTAHRPTTTAATTGTTATTGSGTPPG